MIIDSFMKQGASHYLCEDYVLTNRDYFPLIALSDGCSSSMNTDVGARLITLSAIESINNAPFVAHWFPKFLDGLTKIYNSYSSILTNGFLDATLIVFRFVPVKNNFEVSVIGDGNIILVQGEVTTLYNIKFESNAPKYPAYFIDRESDYNAQYGEGIVIVTKTVIKNGEAKESIQLKDKAKNLAPFSFILDVPIDTDTLLLSTDGIESFSSTESGLISVNDIGKELTAFKNYQGEFMKRRAKRMAAEYAREGITHSDDISFGAIRFKD